MATNCRLSAEIQERSNYSQHMTVGILINSNFPKVIKEDIKQEWRKKIAEDFLNVNLLTKNGISAQLINGKLETWEINMISNASSIKLKVEFSEFSKNLVLLGAYSSNCYVRSHLSKSVKSTFNDCQNMYIYVQVMSSKL